jgi:hypothetical protein
VVFNVVNQITLTIQVSSGRLSSVSGGLGLN